MDSSWKLNLRAKIAILSTMYPDILDAGFSSTVTDEKFTSKDVSEAMKCTGVMKQEVSLEEMLQFQYLVAPDGNTFARSLNTALASDSIVIRPKSQWRTFVDLMLTPGQHYIEVADDVSDLVATVKHFLRNPGEANFLLQKTLTDRHAILSWDNIVNYSLGMLKQSSEMLCSRPNDVSVSGWLPLRV
jgi:hypothetical protein